MCKFKIYICKFYLIFFVFVCIVFIFMNFFCSIGECCIGFEGMGFGVKEIWI